MEGIPPDSPSDLVFDVARGIGSDMQDGIDAAICDLEDYGIMLRNMMAALQKVKKNIIKHSAPAAKGKPEELKQLRLRLKAIHNTMTIARKLDSMLSLTVEDIADVMAPYDGDPETAEILMTIMGESPIDPNQP